MVFSLQERFVIDKEEDDLGIQFTFADDTSIHNCITITIGPTNNVPALHVGKKKVSVEV